MSGDRYDVPFFRYIFGKNAWQSFGIALSVRGYRTDAIENPEAFGEVIYSDYHFMRLWLYNSQLLPSVWRI
ncbi:MAG: hypothetical protein ACJAXY_002530 [Nonlabens sp.]|jgi:hypothetical protein